MMYSCGANHRLLVCQSQSLSLYSVFISALRDTYSHYLFCSSDPPFFNRREVHVSNKRDGSHLESRRPDNDICVGNGAKTEKIWKARRLCSLESFTSFLLLRWALLTCSTKISSSQGQRTGFELALSQVGWDFRGTGDSKELILWRGEKGTAHSVKEISEMVSVLKIAWLSIRFGWSVAPKPAH